MSKLSSENGLSLKQSGVRWLWLAALVFIVDIGSKLLVMNTMEYGWPNRIELLPFFNLLYVHNTGAAFSFLSDAGGWQRWLFAAIALGVCAMLVFWMRKLPAKQKLANVSYALSLVGHWVICLTVCTMAMWSISSTFMSGLTTGRHSILPTWAFALVQA